MYDELQNYSSGHFFFKPTEKLISVCNAPTDKAGIYVVYALSQGRKELVYVGRSGKKRKDGGIQVRIAGCGGIKDRIVNGKHFNRVARRRSWPLQMLLERIEMLAVHWYVTYDDHHCDCPEDVERLLLEEHKHLYGRLPRWNKR